MKSGGTAKYAITLAVVKPNLPNATVTPGGSWHGGTVRWTGCTSVDGVACKLENVPNGKKLYLKYDAPKVTKNTSVTLTLTVTGEGEDKKPLDAATKTLDLLVKKPSTTASSSPAKSSKKPSPGHHATSPHANGGPPNGNIPSPLVQPSSLPSGFPSAPAGPLPPLPNGTPTGLPRLPSVAPSPEPSPRVPNVAEPPRKASGEVHTDAVSLPAAAATAFVGLGAGTAITRSVRRRGLLGTIGRHRD